MPNRVVIVVWLAALVLAGTMALLVGDGGSRGGRLLWAASALDRGPVTGRPPAPRAPGVRPRPGDMLGGAVQETPAPHRPTLFDDYTTPARTHAGRHAVVHYVTTGASAPPLNDDDLDGLPDYVERVAEAADTAVEYYARRGFARIRPDTGGPDARPDLYVSRMTAGTFGVAFPNADAAGGAFVTVANSLDPSPADALGSLYGTVAHEVFHLVQFSYFGADAELALPAWILEGSAAAMETRVHPELDDVVSTLQLRRWFQTPHRPITDQSYGARLLWRRLDERYPRLLPSVLARLGLRPDDGEGVGAFLETFRRVTGEAFGAEFHRFALATAAEHGAELRRRPLVSTVARATVPPLALHLVPLRRTRGRSTVTLRLPARSAVRATLVYEVESEVPGNAPEMACVRPLVSDGGRTVSFRIPEAARRNPRFRRPLLVLSSAAATRPAPYRLAVS